jgi:hypothetical protein
MTREEARQYLENYRKMFADVAPKKFIEALDVILADKDQTETCTKDYIENWVDSKVKRNNMQL